jgi:glycosyltransferase involved in cell wall biosynthesis
MFKVSVVLATFNGEKFIKDQLESILKQIDDDTEIIISDNGSNDNTLRIITDFDDPRIRLIKNPNKKGSALNFEFALQQARGNIIFLADQDDIWLENKFSTCLCWLEKFDIVVTDCKVVNDELMILHQSFFSLNNSGKGIIRNLVKNSYLGCCMAFKRKVLEIAIPFPNGIVKYPMHDIWIGFVAECFFSSYFIDIPLLLYRRHQNNLSTATNKSPFSLMEKFVFRWQTLKYFPMLLCRYLKKR